MSNVSEPPVANSDGAESSLLKRSLNAMTDLFNPLSAASLARLPRLTRTPRYVRVDQIPEAVPGEDGNMPTVRDYHAINSVPSNLRVPRKIATPVRVESKVWFANERTWIAYLNMAILISTLAVALFNASKDDVTRYFAYFYALVSIGILIYGYFLYQHRITMIRSRDPGHFDAIFGPIIISILLFAAVLANFVIRFRELQRKGAVPDPQRLWALVSS